jgi:hypothetical protein
VGSIEDLNGDNEGEILTAPGPSGGPDLRIFDGTTQALLDEFFTYDAGFRGGVFVGAA